MSRSNPKPRAAVLSETRSYLNSHGDSRKDNRIQKNEVVCERELVRQINVAVDTLLINYRKRNGAIE